MLQNRALVSTLRSNLLLTSQIQARKPKKKVEQPKVKKDYISSQKKLSEKGISGSQFKKGSEEYKKMMEAERIRKQEIQFQKFYETLTPKFASSVIMACSLPQSFFLYKIIWSDPCSDAFFWAFECSMTWIGALTAMEAAAGVGLGYIDFNAKHQEGGRLTYVMRRKRLAFGKFPIIMSSLGLFMLNTPSPYVLFPFILSTGWTSLKMATQTGHNLTPERFFYSRQFLSVYNLIVLLLIWKKLSESRREKKNLEFEFFSRVDAIMTRGENLLQEG